MKNKLLWGILGLFLSLGIVGNAWSQEIMRPDWETRQKWNEEFERAPRATIDNEIVSRLLNAQARLEGTSLSLLSHLQYTPTERSQGNCGNCWAWASTGIMEIALSVQNGTTDRFSIQYLNSCKTDQFACCGGNPTMFSNWYSNQGMAIPWSNTNAYFQDGTLQCSNAVSSRSCGDISTTANYPITSIQAQVVPTTGVGQSTAIQNIKSVLNQNKGIYFGFSLGTQADWDAFHNFWNNQNESTLWDPDSYCGHTWVENEGGGHAVLLVGYNDDDPNPANHYWILLNSWGIANGNRPNGLFRMPMYMNYDCVMHEYGATDWYSRQFWTYDVTFGVSGCTYSISPTSQSFGSSGATGSVSVTTQSGCTWTASESLDWVTITSGSSGTGSGTVTYSVSANTGSIRTGTMTIAGQTFMITQEGGGGTTTNLLSNPGFESGPVNWIEYSSGQYPIVTTSTQGSPHSGSWYAWMGGYNNATEYIYQDVTIPSSATQAYVQFWYKIATQETGSTAYDTMAVEVRRPSDNSLLTTLVTLSNLNQTTGWVQSAQYDASSFKGQTIRLRFYTTTDYGLPTSFFVDDTALMVGGGTTVSSNRCDFNGDGKTDILWRNKVTGQNVVWFMNGAAFSSYSLIDAVADTNWQIVGTGDFNGDGKTDILWRNKSTGQNVLWLMNGAAFSSYSLIDAVADTNWQIVGTGDFNGDGKTDILWRNKSTGQNVLWLMNGAAFSSYSLIDAVADTNWQIVGTGDFNSDGKTDILWRNKSTGQNVVWFMNGAAFSSYSLIDAVADTNWEIVGTGDFNSDGKVDILWRNKSTGQNVVWFMNGATLSSYSWIDTVADTNWEIVGPK
jgi:hypothetical protein